MRTTKGKGYAPAEQAQTVYHAVGPFNPATGVAAKTAARRTWSNVFGDRLLAAA